MENVKMNLFIVQYLLVKDLVVFKEIIWFNFGTILLVEGLFYVGLIEQDVQDVYVCLFCFVFYLVKVFFEIVVIGGIIELELVVILVM